MTFWKFFFNSTNKNEKNLNTKKIEVKDKIFINHLNENNKDASIYFSINKDINLYELEKLCDSVGWVRRPLKKVKIAIENSFLIVSVFHYTQNTKRLIGFARATSDESFNATIWDVVIHPEFQGQGLGKEVMNEIIRQLRSYDISTITLFADSEVIKFYRHIGFVLDPDGVKGMFWYPA